VWTDGDVGENDGGGEVNDGGEGGGVVFEIVTVASEKWEVKFKQLVWVYGVVNGDRPGSMSTTHNTKSRINTWVPCYMGQH